MKEIVSLGC